MRCRRLLAANQINTLTERAESPNGEGARKDWLDVLRALAILFVIGGHLLRRNAFYLFTNPVKIPLFFAISGYLMYGKAEDIKTFFRRMFHRIILPWIILSLGFGLRYILTQGFQFYIAYAVEVLVGKRLWYMVCCIIAQSIFYFSNRLFGSGWKLYTVVFLITAAGLTMSAFGVGELFELNTAMVCQFYLLIGYWIRKNESKFLNMKLWLRLAMLSLYLALTFGSMLLFPRRTIDAHNNIYYNIPYCFLLITVGCVALFACVQPIKRFPRWLCAIGRNTLVFYIHNVFWKGMAARCLSLLAITIPDTWYGALVWVFFSCVGCGVEAYILNKFLPEANGKKRKKKAVQAIA